MNTPHCPICLLPPGYCGCDLVRPLPSPVRLILLTHSQELDSPTNTGRLVQLTLPESRIVHWQRTQPDPQLLRALSDTAFLPMLLFPPDRDDLQSRPVIEANPSILPRNPLVLMIDGTWKQARKILRQSPYLDHIPLVTLRSQQPSRYTLRRGAGPRQLCTAEAAAGLIEHFGAQDAARQIRTSLNRFMHNYQACRSGHPLRTEAES